ncbi:MAG TPA: 30S ribosomal protein S20 [Ignavibacteriales bacterium]|jgi:small subunit ribosomal protein S20|nr:30S ribosomal protein S20 [Ignavibacteriales bacterium]
MANHKSAKKRVRQNEKRRLVNKMAISKLKTLTKKLLATTNKEEAEKLFRATTGLLDRYADKGRLHKNTAARKKSQLAKFVQNLTA